jgi:hypothetical protein
MYCLFIVFKFRHLFSSTVYIIIFSIYLCSQSSFLVFHDYLLLHCVCILCYDRRSAGQSVLEQSTHLGLTSRSLLLSDSYGFVDLGRPLWRDNGSVVYNCYWSSPAQSFLGRNRGNILLSHIQDFPFRRFLRLIGLRWRYSIPPPHRIFFFASLIWIIT